jgi:signal transduction histidine kinase
VCEVANPHLDSLFVFELHQGQPQSLFVTGDRLPFADRPVSHRNFVFPFKLKPQQVHVYVFKVYKRGSAAAFPATLSSDTAFWRENYSRNIGLGVYFGVAAIFLLLAITTYLFTQQRIFLLYCLNVLVLIFYLSANLGLAFEFLYPARGSDFNGIVHFSLSLLLFVTWSMFSLEFFDWKKNEPRLRWLLLITNGLTLVFVFIGIAFHERIVLVSSGLVRFNFVLILFVSVSIFIYGFRQLRFRKPETIFFMLAFSSIFGAGILTILRSFGINALPDSINPFLVGSLAEIVTMATTLAFRMRSIYREKNQLALQVSEQSKELLRAYMEGVEKERVRFSRELHDDIGSRLGSLKRFFSSPSGSEKLVEQINSLYEDVRKMSHTLAPPLMKLLGLQEMIIRLAQEAESTTGIRMTCQFYEMPEKLDDETTYHLYRILQEAIHNVSKHSHASECEIQFVRHEHELVLTVEDNGIGFDNSQIQDGIGIKNMRARVSALHGAFALNSMPGHGTSLVVKIPFE